MLDWLIRVLLRQVAAPLMADDGGMEPVYEVNKELEAFHAEADEIKQQIDAIQEKVEEVKRIHSEILSSPREDESKIIEAFPRWTTRCPRLLLSMCQV